MADINKLIPIIKKFEGGYASHPADTDGGCTMRGVTLITFRRYYGKDKTCADLRKITDEQWLHIFKTGYWDKMKADDIKNQSIANLCVDMLYGSGGIAIKKIQRVLGVTADGIVGKITLAAINNANQMDLFNRLKEMRRIWFLNIVKAQPKKAVFIKGWLNRLATYTFAE